MTVQPAWRSIGRRWAAAGSILFSLVCVMVLGFWGAYRDLDQVHQTIWSAEVGRVRSHAERTVGRLETEIVERKLTRRLSELQTDLWLRYYWQRTISQDSDRVYSAITDLEGIVCVHSDRSLEDRGIQWPSTASVDIGKEASVVKLSAREATLKRTVWDISVPILAAGSRVGAYHVGLDDFWLRGQIDQASKEVVRRWMFVIGSIVFVVGLASYSLYSITRRNAELRYSLDQSEIRRARELSQVMSGLAHEIRNPLNAIRLNLHALERVFQNEFWIATDELKEMLGESTGEIDRIANLMTEIVQYSKKENTEPVVVDVAEELRRAFVFLRRELEESQIELRTRVDIDEAPVKINPDRFRQIVLNLIRNAAEAAGTDGWISVSLQPRDGGFTIAVTDSGPGVLATDRELIFEPFYSTKSSGMGLGLSVARKYAMEAKGTLEYSSSYNKRGDFLLWLPSVPATSIQGAES